MAGRNNDTYQKSLAESVLQATDDGILITDQLGQVVKYNPRFAELWRLPQPLNQYSGFDEFQQLLLKHIADPQEYLQSFQHYQNQPLAKGFDTIYLKDGRVFEQYTQPMYCDGELIARIWSFRDFTLADRVQKQLYKETSYRNAILNTLPDLIWLKDTQGIYLACNERFEDFFGAKEIEIIGKSDYDFVDSDTADFFREHDKKAMKKAGPSVNEEWISFANDGHRELLETTKTPLYDHQNNLIGVLGIGHDITKRKLAEHYTEKNAEILEMIAVGKPASAIYDAIALMYEERHPGMRCSLLELHHGKLLHGGAPSLPKAYCEAIHGLDFGPDVGSCGTATYTGKRVIVENIETDPKWSSIKDLALPHGMRSCWSEPIKSSAGLVLGAFGMYYDHPATPKEEESNDLKAAARLASIVMERDQNQKRIHQLAYTDELTGLASRPHFFQTLEERIRTSKRHQRRFSLLYIDLDNFKNINDTLGHHVGDELLKIIAQRLKSVGRDVDFVARLSGDEFCILLDDVSDDYISANLAKRCLDLIAHPLQLSSRWYAPSCSIGIAHYPDDGTDAFTLLKAGDTSLYAAKEQGKNRFAFYNQALTRKAEYRFQFESYLREAIESEQLTLVYQPQLHLTTGQVIGVEALSRWRHPVMGEISPTEFIQIAEQIGMIKPLTETLLYTVCRQAVSWQQQGLPLLRLSVNISPSHFLDEELVTLVERVLKETGMDATLLELEVTETAVQTDQQNISIFSHLKKAGIQIAIDDFGTGYSSIASLKHLKVDSLKIDKYFINDMLQDKKTQYLVNAMIEMGHNLGHTIVAEGIETKAQLELLKRLKCDTAQGYLFSRPVPAEQIPELVLNGIPS
jgi:diguanylate cyclase (GGDEF)-like protein/PAS domain S-box-containing protein